MTLTRAEHAITRLRAVAARSGGAVRLGPGIADETIDGWPVPVPADIRLLAREIGEIWFDDYDPITFRHPENSEVRYCRAGAAGTWWALHRNSAAETYYADIDPATGAWGRVFYHWENNASTLVAPSVADWFRTAADGLELAVRAAAGERVDELAGLDDEEIDELDFTTAFADWWFRSGEVFDLDDSAKAVSLLASDARHSLDPDLAAAAATLREDAVLADLRDPTYPTFVSFNEFRGGTATYRRISGGAFLVAYPGEQ